MPQSDRQWCSQPDVTDGEGVARTLTHSPWRAAGLLLSAVLADRRYRSTVAGTGAVPAMKPEATTLGRSARWPLENNLNV